MLKKSFLMIMFLFLLNMPLSVLAEKYDGMDYNIDVSYDFEDSKIELSGNFLNREEETLSMQIIDNNINIESLSLEQAQSGIAYWNQINTDSNGDFELRGFKLIKSGEYVVRIMFQESTNVYEFPFIYYSKDDIDKAWSLLNSSNNIAEYRSEFFNSLNVLGIYDSRWKTLDDYDNLYSKFMDGQPYGDNNQENREAIRDKVSTLLIFGLFEEADIISLEDLVDNYKSTLGLDLCSNWSFFTSLNHEQKQFIYDRFSQSQIIYYNAEELKNDFDDSIIDGYIDYLFDSLKNMENYTLLKLFLNHEDNAEILNISDYLSRYNNLENSALIDKQVSGKSFSDTEEFSGYFIEKLIEAEKGNNTADSGDIKSNTNSSSGSFKIGGNVIKLQQGEATQIDNNRFDDISDYKWAQDSITVLSDKGIMVGRGNNKFLPGEYITREEFVKIIVEAFKINDGNTNETKTMNFDDVSDSMWYTVHIRKAFSNNLISGVGNNKFGVGQPIKRQDVAVILLNVLNKSNLINNSDQINIEIYDYSAISDYAKKSVELLFANNILTGYNKMFMPLSNLTRAEAAVVIHRILKLNQ